MLRGSYRIIKFLIAAVWLVNGLFCKVFGLVPRHERIVAAILGDEYAAGLTVTIGIAETAMTVWIVSGFRRRLCAAVQIAVVLLMNLLELLLVPELLLWGRANALFALMFAFVVYWNEFRNAPARAG